MELNPEDFTFTLYDNIGSGKRVLNEILNTVESELEEEGITIKNKEDILSNQDFIRNLLLNITLEELASKILWISYCSDTSHRESWKRMESIKAELENSFMRSLPYEPEDLENKVTIEYMQYQDSLLYELYIPYIKGEDITKLEDYKSVLKFLLKKIYIRG